MFRILVVDDEPDLLRRVFERAGHEVADCGNGATALEAAHRSPPDLVVTDMMMPMMGGAELIRRLRGDPVTAQIPILAVTGDAHLAGGADADWPNPGHRSSCWLRRRRCWHRRRTERETTGNRCSRT